MYKNDLFNLKKPANIGLLMTIHDIKVSICNRAKDLNRILSPIYISLDFLARVPILNVPWRQIECSVNGALLCITQHASFDFVGMTNVKA